MRGRTRAGEGKREELGQDEGRGSSMHVPMQ